MKRISFLIFIFIGGLLCIATQCENEKCHKAITFVNKSSKDVYVYSSGYGNDGVPDSSFFVPLILGSYVKVKSNEKRTRTIEKRDCLEGWLRETEYRLNVFVLDVEIYETVPRDIIQKNRMVKTITPTLKEMQRNNWTIYFED